MVTFAQNIIFFVAVTFRCTSFWEHWTWLHWKHFKIYSGWTGKCCWILRYYHL
jgi:hypothetical protein